MGNGDMLDARLRAGTVGTAEGALDMNWPKSHWRGRGTKTATPGVDAFACTEVRLSIGNRLQKSFDILEWTGR